MDDYKIDMIISMLRSKWYVRCGVDGITEQHFNHVEKNITTLQWDKEIQLYRHRCVLFIDEEDERFVYMYDPDKIDYFPIHKPGKSQHYDILINLNITTLEKIQDMFDIWESKDIEESIKNDYPEQDMMNE